MLERNRSFQNMIFEEMTQKSLLQNASLGKKKEHNRHSDKKFEKARGQIRDFFDIYRIEHAQEKYPLQGKSRHQLASTYETLYKLFFSQQELSLTRLRQLFLPVFAVSQ